LLLLFTWDDPAELGIHLGKLSDYHGAIRPILTIGQHRDVVFDVLKEKNAGVHFSSVSDVKQYLLTSYRKFEQQGRVPYNANAAAVGRFSYPEIARKYADVVDSLT